MSAGPRRAHPPTPGVLYIECRKRGGEPSEYLLSFGSDKDGVGAFYLAKATSFDSLTALLRIIGVPPPAIATASSADARIEPQDPDPGDATRSRLMIVKRWASPCGLDNTASASRPRPCPRPGACVRFRPTLQPPDAPAHRVAVLASVVQWCGHRQEFIPVPDDTEWVRMADDRDGNLAVIGASTGRPGADPRPRSFFSYSLGPILSEHPCRSTESFRYVHRVPKRPHEPLFERGHEDAVGDPVGRTGG